MSSDVTIEEAEKDAIAPWRTDWGFQMRIGDWLDIVVRVQDRSFPTCLDVGNSVRDAYAPQRGRLLRQLWKVCLEAGSLSEEVVRCHTAKCSLLSTTVTTQRLNLTDKREAKMGPTRWPSRQTCLARRGISTEICSLN